MFGENDIVGETKLMISKKGKIILPEFTCSEPNDKLGLMYGLGRVSPKLSVRDYLNRTRIVIMRLQEFEEKIESLHQYTVELRESGQIDYHGFLDWQRIIYAMIAISRETVSNLRKIEIPQSPIKCLNITDSVYAVGEEKRLILYPTREQYLSTLKIK